MKNAINTTVDNTCDAILSALDRYWEAVALYRGCTYTARVWSDPAASLRAWFEVPSLHRECAYLIEHPEVDAQEYALMLTEAEGALSERVASIK